MDSEHDSSPDQKITNGSEIAAILKRLLNERCPLTCFFPGSKAMFNTAVINVNPGTGGFELDELNPRHGHERLHPGSVIMVSGTLQGIDTRFPARIGEILQEDGVYFYRCGLPEYLIYRQRREYHRVPAPAALQAVLTDCGNEQAPQLRITDLSAGGIGGVITNGARLRPGGKHRCSIRLPGQAPLAVPIEIRFATLDERGQQRFGARFVDISPLEQRRIARIVMDLERELRRLR